MIEEFSKSLYEIINEYCLNKIPLQSMTKDILKCVTLDKNFKKLEKDIGILQVNLLLDLII